MQISGFVTKGSQSCLKCLWLDARSICGVFLTGRLTATRSSVHTPPAGRRAKFRWPLFLRSECLTRPGVVASWAITLRNAQMRTLFRLETSAFSRPDLPFCNRTITPSLHHSTVQVCFHPANRVVASLIINVAHLDRLSSRASPKPGFTSLQRPPATPTMSDPRLISYLEGMKKRFWHERRHLQQDEIKLQWAARAAPYTSVLLDTEAPTQTLQLTSTSGQQMARQSTSKSWAGMTVARRRASVRTHLYVYPSFPEGADTGAGYRHSSRTWSTLP